MDDHPFALAEFLGLQIEGAEPGRAVARLVAREHHHNPFGVVHGAVLFAMVDTAMGAAALSVLDEGDRCATTDIQLRFLSPVIDGPIEVVATVEDRQRRRLALEARAVAGDGRLVALATGEFAVIPAT